jgi:uncharacterized membrane protein
VGLRNLLKISKIPAWPRVHGYEVASLLLVVIAAALRFYKLGDTSLWLDEAVYATNAFHPFSEFLHLTRTNNSTPIALPLLYWLFGRSLWDPFLIRVFPAVFGTLTVAVVLRMRKVGLSGAVTIPAAVWLTLSPLQIEYSQEVREYSFSVLVTTLLLYSFLGSASSPESRKNERVFAMALFLAPLASYGGVLIGGALLALDLAVSVGGRRFSLRRIVNLFGSFGLSLLLSYFITARYQIGVAQAEYLAGHYPVGSAAGNIKWLFKSTMSYLRLGSVIPRSGVVVFLVVTIFGISRIRRGAAQGVEARVVFALFTLILLSWALTFLHLYPFGGMRQHLFATPLIVLATVAAFVKLGEACRIPPWLGALALTAVITPPLIKKIPRVYREHQDIRSTVNAISSEVGDESVFVYFAAIPAVSFHFPERGFYHSKTREGDIRAMADEIEALPGCKRALVFSHILKEDDKGVVQEIGRLGYRTIRKKVFKGTALYEISKCGGG